MLRAQDLVIALHVATTPPLPQRAMSDALGLSQAEISNALRRLRASQLLMHSVAEVITPHLLELCVHGVRFVFPPELGPATRGVPTAAMVSPLRDQLAGDGEHYVWPAPDGSERASSIEPLHPCVVHAARRDPRLHRLLSFVDGIRIGRTRMRAIAAELLAKELGRGRDAAV